MANVAEFLLADIKEQMLEQAFTMSGTMMGVVQPIASALMVAYLTLWGASVASGRSQEPFGDGIRRIVKMIFIIVLGFTASSYNSEVCEVLFNLPGEIAGQLVGAGGSSDGVAKVIDKSLQRGLDVAMDYIRDTSFWAIGDSIRNVAVGAVVAVLTIILCGIAIAFVYIAYVAMGILLAVGPFFIMFLVFDQTRRFFDGWLSQVVTFVVLYILIAAAVIICFSLIEHYAQDATHNIPNALRLMVAFLCMIAVMVQVRPIAAAIGGGISMQTMSAAAGVLRSATSLARPAAAAASVGRSVMSRAASPAATANRARQTFKPNQG